MSSTKQNDYQKRLPAPLSHENELLAAVHLDSNIPAEWSSGLSNCCSDASLCCITCWCPCVTVGRIAEAVDDGKISCIVTAGIHALLTYGTGCGWIYSLTYRSKIRKQYMLGGSPFQDCLAHLCCERCALCQEYRELQLHGATDEGEAKYGVEAVPVAPKGMIR
ncbi:protein PLANT CADMIUM RESISTANCE 2 [Artemisia annua]|uniref:Protein PLANT CADMIUM RESISTANCE 2 n=1 Tax=Artemisia annua TaxID=35608 RepID=A0A2U1M3H2_ARTAN|nr:protein PLANT CADMIUM RESISTANCE 2 [Artemisia annua]